MSCLTDEVFAAWVSGQLDARELEQVESHAADCAVCRGMAIAMRGLVPHVATTLGAIGATIGRYQVVAPLGEGAMGVVVRGRDPVLERDVAIKMVNAIAMTTEQRDLMLHEAKMLALVDHPNVVRVHDAGIVEDEVFVAMELLGGITVARWLAEQPPTVAERLAVLVGVGAGIAAIHDAGLVHRDIKPDNILVCGTRGVIVDFGLARAVGTAGLAGSGIAGTPAYFAPEVRRGSPATQPSDQFAWWTVVGEALQDIALPPRGRRALAAAIARGRADEPEDRFPNMRDAVAALTAACAPARRPWRAIAIGGVAVVALAVTAGIAIDRIRTGRADAACAREGDVIVTRWRAARGPIHDAFLASGAPYAQSSFDGTTRVLDRFVPELAAQIAGACRGAPAGEPPGINAARRRCLDERAQELAGEIDRLSRATRNDVREAVDGAWAMAEPACTDVRALAFGPYSSELPQPDLRDRLRRARQDRRVPELEALLADTRARGDRSSELVALHLLGDMHEAMQQPDAAIDAYQQALRLAESLGRDLDAAKMLALIAEQLGIGKHDAASGHRTAAVARAKLDRIGGNMPALDAYLHRVDAEIYHREYRCRDAEAEIRQALARYEQAYGPDHPYVGIALSEVADFACETSDATVAAATRSLGILQQAYGADHPNVGGARLNLGDQLIAVNHPQEALDQLRRADAIFERAFGSRHPARISVLLSLGDAEDKLGHPERQLDAYRRAGTLIDASAGPESPEAGASHNRIGDALLAGVQLADALVEYRRALAIAEHALGPEHLQVVDPLAGIARAELALGRASDALAPAERAIALLAKPDAHADPGQLARVRFVLARALWDANRDRRRAHELATQARAALDGADAGEVAAWLATHAP